MQKEIMKRAAQEIRELRQRLAVASAKAEAVDIIGMALRAQPGTVGYGEDIAWLLEKEVEDMTQKESTEK